MQNKAFMTMLVHVRRLPPLYGTSTRNWPRDVMTNEMCFQNNQVNNWGGGGGGGGAWLQ